ncbi:beta-propeller fold lactonase family protein [Nocardia bovistercoris]|uniref:YncE family protein n=1 Tax=Nocardia bovistercoris TaxID=2785916 RepID=A0A931N3C1_9NOCA|nr:YncE family protein [Nocardia bovistercoris]MBH0776408.1 YncE family protein [Nocardia bovistercoris]
MVLRSIAVTLAAVGLTVLAPNASAELAAPRAYIPVVSDGTVLVVDTAADRVVQRIDGVGRYSSAVTPSRDGSKLYVQAFNPPLIGEDDIAVIDRATDTVSARVPITGTDGPAQPITDPVRDQIYILTARPSIDVVSTRTDTLLRSMPLPSIPFAAAIAPDGSKLYAIFADSTAAAFDPESGFQLGGRIQIDGSLPYAAAVSPDGHTLYSVNALGDNVSVIDTVAWRRTGAISFGAGSAPVAGTVSPDGDKLVVATLGANAVQVIDMTTNAIVGKVPVDAPVSVGFTADGAKMYVGSLGQQPGILAPIAAKGFDSTVLPAFLQSQSRPGALIPFSATDFTPAGAPIGTGTGPGFGAYPR